MAEYAVTVPEGTERGVRVRCVEHDEAREFRSGYRTVAFYCAGCGTEVELTVHDPHDPRDLGERC